MVYRSKYVRTFRWVFDFFGRDQVYALRGRTWTSIDVHGLGISGLVKFIVLEHVAVIATWST